MPRFNWQLRVASGLISFGFGLLLVYEIGFADGGLFTADADLGSRIDDVPRSADPMLGRGSGAAASLFV